MATVVVDTNVLVRFFTGEPRGQFERATAVLKDSVKRGDTLIVHPVVVAETVFVLGGPRLAVPLTDQVRALNALLDLPLEILERNVVQQAVELYADGATGWLDCYLAAYARAVGEGKVVSFDAGFDRLEGVSRLVP